MADEHGVPRSIAADAFGNLQFDPAVLADPVTVGVTPTPFSYGPKTSDPLQSFVQSSSDPHTTLEFLEMLGHPAISSLSIATTSATVPIDDPIPVDDDCVQISADDWLSQIEATFSSSLQFPDAPPEDIANHLTALQSCCEPFVLTLPPGSSPWTCGDFSLQEIFHNIDFGQCIYQYFRIATRSEGRVRLEGASDCSTTWCVQWRACSADQYAECSTNAQPTLPPGGTCEGTVCDAPQVECGPSGDTPIECNAWNPASCP